MSLTPATLARSRHKVGTGYHGKIPPGIWEVLVHAATTPIYTKSNFAREAAQELAAAASLGWVSTIDITGSEFLPYYLITAEGLHAYRNRKDT